MVTLNPMVTVMPVTADSAAPYAPPTAIVEVLDRNRTKGIPNPINGEVLERAGVTASLIPRTLQALRALDLIKEDGSHTEVLEGLRRAPEGEYKQRLVQWLDAAYADARQYVDPATDDEVAVRDAFRNYNPFGQQARMVTLFLGLYEKAGMVEKRQAAPRPPSSAPRKAPSPRSAPRVPAATAPKDQPFRNNIVHQTGNLPAALNGLLTDLPTIADGWTKADRDRFLVTFNAVLDFCFPVSTAPKRDNKSDEGGDDR